MENLHGVLVGDENQTITIEEHNKIVNEAVSKAVDETLGYWHGRERELLDANNREVELRRRAENCLLRQQYPRYIHIKSNSLYEVLISAAIVEATFDGNNKQVVVVYRDVVLGTVWTRPYNEFYDGRFRYIG